MSKSKAIMLAVAAVLVAGCAENDPNAEFGVYSAPREKTMAVVNGEAIRVGDFLDRQRTELAFFSYSNGKRLLAAAEADSRFAERLAKIKSQREGGILAELVNQSIVEQYMAKTGVDIPAAEAETTVSNSLKKIGFKSGLDAFAATNGIDAAVVKRHILAPLRIKQAVLKFAPESDEVSEEEIDAGLKRQDDYKALAVASNTVTFATCSNLLARIAGGETFEHVGLTNGFSPQEAEEWDNLVHDEFTNPAFEEWAFSAPIGSVGGPYELDDCIAVFKILDRVEGTREKTMVSRETASVRLARIGFPVIDVEPEPHTREFVKDTLVKWKMFQSQKKLMNQLHEAMELEYPNGTNFTYTTSN